MENEKKMYTEQNRKLEQQQLVMERRLAEMNEETRKLQKETKDLRFARHTSGSVLENKIRSLESEKLLLLEVNARLQAELDAATCTPKPSASLAYERFGEEDDFDRAVAVKAKPRLFGDADTE